MDFDLCLQNGQEKFFGEISFRKFKLQRLYCKRWNYCIYYTLNSLPLFWLAKSVLWTIEIGTCSVSYTLIIQKVMSRTLKITGNHVMYDYSAWFLWVITSSLCALRCLPSVKKQKHDFHFITSKYNKSILLSDSVFVISRIIKV